MEYYSAIKSDGIGSFVEMWMDLQSFIQSEVRKRKINVYIWNLEKMVLVNLFAEQQWRQTENRLTDTTGGGGRRGWDV